MRIDSILRALLLSLLLLSFSAVSHSAVRKTPPRNKPLAILLSLVSPGMGQLYEGNIGTGLALWTASGAVSFAFFLTIGDIDLQSAWTPTVRYRLKPALTSDQMFWAAGFAFCYGLLYTYNLVDAATYNPDQPVALSVGQDGAALTYSVRW